MLMSNESENLSRLAAVLREFEKEAKHGPEIRNKKTKHMVTSTLKVIQRLTCLQMNVSSEHLSNVQKNHKPEH